MKRVVLAACLVAFIGLSPARAVLPDEVMADPAKEARARELSRELRCMVCQNQSIDDSEAPLARDLRLLVRERIAAGDNPIRATRHAARTTRFMCHSAACRPRTAFAGFGAPTRSRRSDSDNSPPKAISTGPNQISSTSGL